MSSPSFTRIGTATQYDSAIRNISARQTSLSNLQENLTSGKRVVRASDDPVAAAQAERAMTRIARIQTEQRALDVQRNAVAQAESSLGDAIGLVQQMRELVVSAGNGGHSASDRKTIATQLQSLRDQLLEVSNRKDTNGVPLLAALGSDATPFLNAQMGFHGLPGQGAGSAVSIPNTLDGDAAFMFQPQRDGAYNARLSLATPAGRALGTDSVRTTDPAQLTGDKYTLSFTAVAPTVPADGTTTATYTITNDTTGALPTTVTAVFPSDKPADITVTGVPGLSFSIKGTPASGDSITLEPSTSIFNVIDDAIRDIGGAGDSNAAAQAVGQALANMDRGMERLQSVRGYAGELLNRADRITGDQDKRAIQLEADRSRAEDLDMIQGISDFQNQQVGYQAALQSYAMVQKLSLFNFIS
ncbi:flagellar hook-associated protein FlgL [Acidovorax sp. SRB_24]|uniref:flagellar hook-associated protein FlgL n=1 Tax=Acidovorax sp. SRB_24 TaxID=1962700 RepID=UPI00145D82C7|nr:flagellar hook-associated protein FlgL [Acidovorax sp. SRB_24]NMM77257.1 flagellar hook-associated protein 3 [Acidovorax sp. SRB_24]